MRRALLVFAVLAILAVGVGFGLYTVLKQRPEKPPAAPPRPPDIVITEETPAKVKVYRVVVENNQPVVRAEEKAVKPGEDPVEIALRRLVEQGHNADLANPIPKGTRLLGVKITDGLAQVNLSREFRENFRGGSMAEALIIDVILQTLGQFSEVKQVRLLLEGKPLDTLGHADLSEPLDVRWVSPEFLPKAD